MYRLGILKTNDLYVVHWTLYYSTFKEHVRGHCVLEVYRGFKGERFVFQNWEAQVAILPWDIFGQLWDFPFL